MKNFILLKLIQNLFSSKSIFTPMKTKLSTGTQKDSGFTIIELMIVVLVIGILSAIAAPSWDAFVNRQRIRTVNNDILRVLKKAQNEAKSNKRDTVVEFKYVQDDPVNDPPRWIIMSFEETDDGNIPIPDNDPRWQSLDVNGEIKAGMIELSANVCTNNDCTSTQTDNAIVFNLRGEVRKDTEPEQETPFVVTISRSNGQRRCVFVQTLLGGMRTDEGEFISGKGCP